MSRILLCDKLKNQLDNFRPFAPETLQSLREYYRVGLTYSSNALEGNSLTESETKIVIEDGLTIQGRPLKDIYEAIGHAEAYDYLQQMSVDKDIEAEDILKLHELFYKRISAEHAGHYRNVKVFISGSHYPLPPPEQIPARITEFLKWLKRNEDKLHPVELAAEVHKRFVFIHPFIDGNGRVSRLLMNLILMRHGYPITIIPPILRAEYITVLEEAHKDSRKFVDFIMAREIETLKELIRLLGGVPQMKTVPESADSVEEVYLLLKEHPGWRVPSLVKATGKSRATVERYLRQLRDMNRIEFRGAPKNGGYFVK